MSSFIIKIVFIFSICIISTQAQAAKNSTCQPGTWSNWKLLGNCPEPCGACAKATFTRNCTIKNKSCPCEGESTKLDFCNIKPCKYPKKSCCKGFYARGSSDAIYCAPVTLMTPLKAPSELTNMTKIKNSNCSPDGVWTEWKQNTSCTATCGACGIATFTRTCISHKNGCPCTGNSTKIDFCNSEPCSYPAESCCAGFYVLGGKDGIYCTPCGEGTWSEWVSGTCNATCGLCGTQTRTRKCLSEKRGCPCIGESVSKPLRCGNTICKFPDPLCCPPAKRGIVDKKVVCVEKNSTIVSKP